MEIGGFWTIVISVIGTLGVTYFGHSLGLSKDKELRQDELDRHARYLAIRTVCTLDPFVSECCDVVLDDGLPDQDGDMHPRVGDPTLSLPEDVDWKSVKPDLMYRVLDFPNKLDIARQTISWVANEVAGPPDHREYFQERTIQYGQLGLIAYALAEEIRETYSIPERDYGNWHPKKTLEDALVETKKEQEASRSRQAELMGEIADKSARKPSEAKQRQ